MKHFYRMARMLLLIVCSMTVGLPQAKAQYISIGGEDYYDDVFTYETTNESINDSDYWTVGGWHVEEGQLIKDYPGYLREILDGESIWHNEYIVITGLKDRAKRLPESARAVAIPATINGKRVRDIDQNVFAGHPGVQYVYVDANLARFQGFTDCPNLKSVIFSPDAKTKVIGRKALKGCTSLTQINIPSEVLFIEEEAFKGCTNLEKVWFTSDNTNLIRLGDSAFEGCSSLNYFSINSPLEVETCGKNVFYGTALTQNVYNLNLKPGMYAGCTKMTSILGNPNWTEVPENCFDSCPVQTINLERTSIETLDLNHLPQNNVKSGGLTLNEGLKNIVGSWKADNVKALDLPGTVETIEKDAFKYVTDLRVLEASNLSQCISVGFPNVETLWLCNNVPNDFARGSLRLKQVNFFDGCTRIGDRAFMDCPLLSGFGFENKGVAFGQSAFSGCSNLTIKGTVRAQEVGADAFRHCKFGAVKFIDTKFLANSMAGLSITTKVELENCTALEEAFTNSTFTDLTVDQLCNFYPCAFKGTKGHLTYNALDKGRTITGSPFQEAEFTTVTTLASKINQAFSFQSMPLLERIIAPNLTTLNYDVTRETPRLQGYDGLNNGSYKSVVNTTGTGQIYYTVYSADMQTLYHVGETCDGTVKVASQCNKINTDFFRTSDAHTKITVLDLREVKGNVILEGPFDGLTLPSAFIIPGTESQFQSLADAGMKFITENKLGDSNHDGQVDVEDIVVTATELGK